MKCCFYGSAIFGFVLAFSQLVFLKALKADTGPEALCVSALLWIGIRAHEIDTATWMGQPIVMMLIEAGYALTLLIAQVFTAADCLIRMPCEHLSCAQQQGLLQYLSRWRCARC